MEAIFWSWGIWGRLIDGASNPLSFSIPSEVLGLIGIVSGSGVAAGVVKSSKDTMASERIAASSHSDPPRLSQIFLMEEGAYADKVIDITKFQGFVITLILLVAYAALAVHAVHDAGSAKGLAALPGFSGTFLTLLGISQGTYIAGKIPSQQGTPPGLTVENRPTGSKHTMPKGFKPRNAK